jgi:hypothetical protein
MGQHYRIAVLFLLLGIVGCKRKAPSERAAAPAPSASVRLDSAPLDELAEGDEQAFGLAIPRAMRVKQRFPDAVFATGTLEAARLVGYVRERVVPGRLDASPAKTLFSRATLKKEPSTLLEIVVVPSAQGVELVVRDVTPPPVKGADTPAERMRAAGLTPTGELLNKDAVE